MGPGTLFLIVLVTPSYCLSKLPNSIVYKTYIRSSFFTYAHTLSFIHTCIHTCVHAYIDMIHTYETYIRVCTYAKHPYFFKKQGCTPTEVDATIHQPMYICLHIHTSKGRFTGKHAKLQASSLWGIMLQQLTYTQLRMCSYTAPTITTLLSQRFTPLSLTLSPTSVFLQLPKVRYKMELPTSQRRRLPFKVMTLQLQFSIREGNVR